MNSTDEKNLNNMSLSDKTLNEETLSKNTLNEEDMGKKTLSKKLSVVVSVYNEEMALDKFYDAIHPVLDECAPDYELLFVNDGSTDGSMEVLRKIAGSNSKVRVIKFSRNFGHEAAMLGGIDSATGDYVVCMDADLQHPVECLPPMMEQFADGVEVISMVRTKNKDAGAVKSAASTTFYRVLNSVSTDKVEKNASDFFGISKRVAEILKSDYRERVRFIRGYVQNVGFKKAVIEYEAAERVAGKSKYSLSKLVRMSIDTIMCFSDAPLKAGIYIGIVALLLGIVMAVYTVITWIQVGAPSGYATIVVLLCFMFGVQFIILGIQGEYLSVLFSEVKQRPIYIIEETVN